MAGADLAAVEDVVPIEDEVPIIESEPDEETKPFKVAYQRGGKRVVEDFSARIYAPFAIFRRIEDLERASKGGIPDEINLAVTRLFTVALTDESSTRLLRLIQGDADEVGVITGGAIGGVVDLIRSIHYKTSPTRPGSSTGGSRAGRGSPAARSVKKSTSKPSPRKKA